MCVCLCISVCGTGRPGLDQPQSSLWSSLPCDSASQGSGSGPPLLRPPLANRQVRFPAACPQRGLWRCLVGPCGSSSSGLLGLLLLDLDVAVAAHAKERKRSAGGVERANGVVERNDGGHNDDDTLDALADAVGDGRHALEHHVRQLLVGVEADARHERLGHNAGEGLCAGGAGRECQTVHGKRNRRTQKHAHNRDDGEEVNVVQAGLDAPHHLFGEDIAAGEGEIGAQC
mmetsp:Transcript_34958/g.87527  ORF Transcript_34958/g.87527 Transcript_34958/m.87527 type:complete len:230 (+) Transcript_34958:275-964(+)